MGCMFGVGSCFDMCAWLVEIFILSTPSLESYRSSLSWPKVELVNLILFQSIVLLQSLGTAHCCTSINNAIACRNHYVSMS